MRYAKQARVGRGYLRNPITSASEYGLMQSVLHGGAKVKGISQAIAEELIRRTPKRERSKFAKELAMSRAKNRGKGKGKGRRANPSGDEIGAVEDFSEKFHGREPREQVEVDEVEKFDDALVSLGELRELSILTADGKHTIAIKFKKQRPTLACDAIGVNLEIVGGDQELDTSNLEDLVTVQDGRKLYPLGLCQSICYFTDKHHLEGPAYQKDGIEYEHEFGEVTGVKPCIMYDGINRKLLIVGGEYTIEEEGITN